MTVRLRAHHLLCMLTYVGRGYTPAFVTNYDGIIGRLGAGEWIELVDGPDDVCSPLLSEAEFHCHSESVRERDRLARIAVDELLGPTIYLAQIFRVDARMLSNLRAAFSTGQIRPACAGCEWVELCDSVARSGYSDTKLVASIC